MGQPESSDAYFSHMQGAQSEGVPLQNATRYLCAAAYLDQSFAQKVLREFVEEDHRGVVPSFGFDVAPVVGHCLRARRMRIVRDAVLFATLILGMALDSWAVLVLVFFWLPLAAVPFIRWSKVPWVGRIAAAWFYSGYIVAVWAAIFALSSVFSELDSGSGQDLYQDGFVDPDQGTSTAPAKFLLVGALVFVALVLVPLGYRLLVYRTLQSLGPGSDASSPQAVSNRVQQTLNRVAAAQRGNITLYSHENPFLGSGDVTAPWARAWSIALELDRPGGTLRTELSKEPTPKKVNPVELHQHVHRRLVAMRDGLPPHERVGGLLVDWHVVAEGDCMQGTRPVDPTGMGPQFQGHPLIDAHTSVPYSWTSEDTIAAIISHPQANIRCYQRVTVGTQGQAIRDRVGLPIAPAEDQDIMLSTFLYLAVEGRMLYAQFVVNVMPPIRDAFLIVDALPSYGTGMILWRTVREGGTRALGEGLLGPFRLIRTCVQLAREGLKASGRLPASFLSYDYGARLSVREAAAENGFRTFMQTLDADKYTNLIERRINEAVLDYLQQCDVNVTAYREQAAVVMNSPFIMTGGSISGSQIAVGGSGAHIVQEQSRQSRPNP